jgi:hypothetical protein
MEKNITINENTQTGLLLRNLLNFYQTSENIQKMLEIVNGESHISLRIIDWFITNYAKKFFVVYEIKNERFKIYNDYKLNLKAYSKHFWDIFQRWERISIPVKINGEEIFLTTTIGQLNIFKWLITNKIIEYIKEHYEFIEKDMIERNSTSKKKRSGSVGGGGGGGDGKTRKRREELSEFACKTIKMEKIDVVIRFK